MDAVFEPRLPGTSPLPHHFHMGHPTPWSEGGVVRITPKSGESWIANCQPGNGYVWKIVVWEEALGFIVIANGACYLIHPETPGDWVFIADLTIDCAFPPRQELAIVATYSDVIAIQPDGSRIWDRRVAIDGVEITDISDSYIWGRAGIDPPDDWQEFQLDIRDGSDL